MLQPEENMKRVGFYCWAGPGTVRMTKLKYFDPGVDEASILRSYEYEYLKKMQDLFGITDAWVSYSWGFSDEAEKEDREYILSRLPNFKRLGIKVHAYIQGPNVVYSHHPDKDWYCVDERGARVSYHRGRHITCLNNPGFREYVRNKVAAACQHDFNGIFIDNIHMGKLGVPDGERYSSAFVGCNCRYCKEDFEYTYGMSIPTILHRGSEAKNVYLEYRSQLPTKFLQELSEIAHAHGKQFGSNSYDPKFNYRYVYGTNIPEIAKFQDYVLFENHSLPNPRNRKGNGYIQDFVEKNHIDKPVFVVSYKKGISWDSEFTQKDIDLIFSEAARYDFNVCLKGSEYLTKKVWHNFTPEKFRKPVITDYRIKTNKRRNHRPFATWPLIDYIVRRWGGRGAKVYMENRWVRKFFSFAYRRIMD